MLNAAHLLKKQHENIKFLISLAPSVKRERVEDIIGSCSPVTASHFSLVSGSERLFQESTLLVAASGTVTLEAAMAGAAMVIIYKVSFLSYLIGRAMIRVKHISLVNLIAGREIVPELIQDKASPQNIAATVSRMLNDPASLDKMRNDLLHIRNMLGAPGASERVADIAEDILCENCIRGIPKK